MRAWDGLSEELMADVYALIGPSLGKSTVAPPKPKREKSNTGRLQGQIKTFNEAKKYGFIRSGTDDYFFHISAAADPDLTYLMRGERVTFEIGEDRKGRPAAVKISLIGGKAK